MRRIFFELTVGAIASGLVGSAAIAQNMEEVTVSATRAIAKAEVGHTASGIPINEMSLSYAVSYAGLDLASSGGAAELKRRVNDAAKDACKGISSQYPLVTFSPNETDCARIAADKAMRKVSELITAAERKSAK